ncbi:hypothetical protein EG327_010487 [Venturia inaequalis]|uniref:Uncharacterized protein n=1 Tax=Venturia inaequalis TaxID=5025 RepID=A0A8H3UHW0_VENIN|nr:hypothetical protein EG327_010487 [Venturia inaequalis]
MTIKPAIDSTTRNEERSLPTTTTTTMASTTPIPAFDYMFQGEEDSSGDEEDLDVEKRDSKVLRFDGVRVKERGALCEERAWVVDGGDDVASLCGSMAAVALASVVSVGVSGRVRGGSLRGQVVSGTSTSTLTEVFKGESVDLGLRRVRARVSTPSSPSEVFKGESVDLGLRRVRARVSTPPSTGIWQSTKSWFRETPRRIRDTFSSRRGEEGIGYSETVSTASSVSVEGGEEERGRSRSSSREEEYYSLPEEETLKVEEKARDSLGSVGGGDITSPNNEKEILEKQREASPSPSTPKLEPSPKNPPFTNQTVEEVKQHQPTRPPPKISFDPETQGVKRTKPEVRKTKPEIKRCGPDRGRSFRSGTPPGQDSRVKLWPKENQGCGRRRPKMRGTWRGVFWPGGERGRGVKPWGTWKAKWRGF